MYNPFDKKIDDLDFDDLKKLIDEEVKEGFYIEYKSDFQNNKKIAKSIASFANTHGGWYFVGIEDDDDTNVATDLVGFDVTENNQTQEKIQNIAKDHINPVPLIHTKLIKFNTNKGILVIFIPESYETPHILSNGVIYRRTGEQSDPIKETDRYALDKLYQKSVNFEERFQNILKDTYSCPEGPIIKIFLVPKRFDNIKIENFYKQDFLTELKTLVREEEELLKDIEGAKYSILTPNITRSTNSIIFRNTFGNRQNFDLSLEFVNNGIVIARIPLMWSSLVGLLNASDSPKPCLEKIREHISSTEAQSLKLIHIYDLILRVKYVFQKFVRYFEKIEVESEILLVVEFNNIGGAIPFAESEFYLEYLKEYDVPICLHNNKKIPDGHELKPWVEFGINELEEEHFGLSFTILEGLGLSTFKIGDKELSSGFAGHLVESSKGNNS